MLGLSVFRTITSQIVKTEVRMLDYDLPAVLSVLLYVLLGELLATQRTGLSVRGLLLDAAVTQARAAGSMLLYH